MTNKLFRIHNFKLLAITIKPLAFNFQGMKGKINLKKDLCVPQKYGSSKYSNLNDLKPVNLKRLFKIMVSNPFTLSAGSLE